MNPVERQSIDHPQLTDTDFVKPVKLSSDLMQIATKIFMDHADQTTKDQMKNLRFVERKKTIYTYQDNFFLTKVLHLFLNVIGFEKHLTKDEGMDKISQAARESLESMVQDGDQSSTIKYLKKKFDKTTDPLSKQAESNETNSSIQNSILSNISLLAISILSLKKDDTSANISPVSISRSSGTEEQISNQPLFVFSEDNLTEEERSLLNNNDYSRLNRSEKFEDLKKKFDGLIRLRKEKIIMNLKLFNNFNSQIKNVFNSIIEILDSLNDITTLDLSHSCMFVDEFFRKFQITLTESDEKLMNAYSEDSTQIFNLDPLFKKFEEWFNQQDIDTKIKAYFLTSHLGNTEFKKKMKQLTSNIFNDFVRQTSTLNSKNLSLVQLLMRWTFFDLREIDEYKILKVVDQDGNKKEYLDLEVFEKKLCSLKDETENEIFEFQNVYLLLELFFLAEINMPKILKLYYSSKMSSNEEEKVVKEILNSITALEKRKDMENEPIKKLLPGLKLIIEDPQIRNRFLQGLSSFLILE